MPDLRNWLGSLNLDGYYQTFIENRIDSDVLPDLTEGDLEKLQIPLGDRKRLMRAIRAFSEETGGAVEPASVPPAMAGPGSLEEVRATLEVRGHDERLRHMTVMFVDLVGSTGLSEELDIEDYWQAITSYQQCCSEIIQSFHGFVARYLGDGVLAYFGYPRAAEHDAERAVAAGLEIGRAVSRIESRSGVRLEARIGVATGKVLISDIVTGHLELKDTALGNTPNLAARLQTLAEPGTVVISESTRSLLGNHVDCVHVGSLSLKGFSEPVSVWQVRRVHFTASRFESRQKGPMTPLSGRDEELAVLLNRWRCATKGEGRVALISGEAGIGKSRLVDSLCNQIRGEPHIRLRYQCSPFHASSALYPVISQLRLAAGLGHMDSNQAKLDKLEDLLRQSFDDVQAVAPLFARLLSIPDEGRYRPLQASAEVINEETKLALLEQYFGLAKARPVVAVFEDIHWIDPSTEELLGMLISRIASRNLLILCTYRPEFEAPWAGQAGISTLHLNRLDHRQSLQMIRQLCSSQELPPELEEAIAGKTEGVPLFIEELTKSVLESDRQTAGKGGCTPGEAAAALALPSTLNELLMAKLDSLSGAGEVVPICAAIGRSFTYRLLALVSGLSDDKLRAILDKLIQAQILLQVGHWPEVTYSFRHSLIQEAAYATMLKSRVKSLHAKIADTVVAKFADYAARSPEVVAYHYSRAAMAQKARDFWAAAGNLAIERSAYLEAIAHFEAALEENAQLDDEQERVRSEIALRERLVIPLEARFWGSDDIASNLSRLHELQSEHGDDKDLFAVLDGLYGTHIISGKADLALNYALQMAQIAESLKDATFSLISQHAMAMCHFVMGHFDAALEHYLAAIQLRPQASPDIMRQYYLADVEIIDQCMQSWAYVLSGQHALAEAAIERAGAITEAAENDFSRAYGFSILASAHQGMGDAAACLDYASRAVALSQRHKFRYWEAWAQIMQGWAQAAAGKHNEGIEELTAGLERYMQTGSKQIIPYAKSLLADTYLRAGRIMSGLTLIEEIESADESSPVRFHRAIASRVAQELRAASKASRAGGGG